MGVVIHILDRRSVCLDVAGFIQEIGTLRHMSKITELDESHVAELEGSNHISSPPAAMVAHPVDLPLASDITGSVAAHPVIGWDEGRGSVTDLGWDYLPVLGYAVRDARCDMYVLHELQDGVLHSIDAERAYALGLIVNGTFSRRGQPVISECFAVEPFIPGFIQADCILENGRRDKLIIRVDDDTLPDPSWLVGRKPRDTMHYTAG
ncbi:hypothetical protein [Lichenicola sp.]|uniref:hypothetical protein n=1 Tax=Lichenicola sp. TaxID=2804529 RepID=UPI003AFF936F